MECVEKWRLEELCEIVSLFSDDISERIKENNIKSGEDYTNILLHIGGSSIVCMREVICLSSCGFPDGCLARARLLCEHAVILFYFDISQGNTDFQKMVDNYHKNYEIERLQKLSYFAKQRKTVTEKKYENELNKIKSTIPEYKKNNYWWSKKNSFTDIFEYIIKETEKETQFDGLSNGEDETKAKETYLHHLQLEYKLACLQIHSSNLGNMWRVGKNIDYSVIDTSETDEGHSLPLSMALKSFSIIIFVICKNLGIDYNNYANALNNLILFYEQESSNLT